MAPRPRPTTVRQGNGGGLYKSKSTLTAGPGGNDYVYDIPNMLTHTGIKAVLYRNKLDKYHGTLA